MRNTVPTAWTLILTTTAQYATFTSVTPDDPIGDTIITRITTAGHVIVIILKIQEGSFIGVVLFIIIFYIYCSDGAAALKGSITYGTTQEI